MKLKVKLTVAKPRVEKIKLEAECVELIDHYREFYQLTYKQEISMSQLMNEITVAFIKTDRDFMMWHRSQLNTEHDKSS